MGNKNIIIGILSAIIIAGGTYIYLLPVPTNTKIVKIPTSPILFTTEVATTAPPYIAPEPDEPVENTTQTGKIDEHLTIDPTLRDVNFCGNTYKVKQVLIDGVDVVQRIAKLATNKEFIEGDNERSVADYVCLNTITNANTENLDIQVGKSTDRTHQGYVIRAVVGYVVDIQSGNIYYLDAIGGGPIGPIATLK